MSASESLMPGPQGKTPRYYDVDRGTKTESYISAISGNPLPPPKATPQPQKTYSQVPSGEIEQFQVDTKRDQVGLTEKELTKYRSDVKWRVIRIVLLLLLILLWLAMFLGVVYVVWSSPGCVAQEKPHWWQSAVAYNIWIPSFQDSDGDGVGDVTGIINRLENLRKSGIQTVWPNPFLLSDNMGSAVRNFAQMDSRFGVNQLADDMIQKIHDKDMKVVISIPIATTSLEHEWFLASASASKPENKNYSEFYHWSSKDPDGEFFSKHKNLVYLHEQNDSRAAVLNWQSSQVRSHMFAVLSDWIDRGVDGFYLQGIEYLARTAKGDKADWSAVQDVLRDIRDHVDTYANESLALKEKKTKRIALFASRDNANEKDKRLLAATGIDSIINYELGKIVKDTDICHRQEGTVANCVHEILSDVLLFHKNNEKVLPQWEFGNPYVSRVATRVGSRAHAELLSMIQLLLPGVNNIYYGDELGMRDLANDTKVPVQRGAMQWTGDKHAGFSEVTPEIPVHPDYKNINWERQYTSGSSHLKMFSKLAKLRQRDDVIKTGKTFIGRLVDEGFVLTRFSQKANITTGNIYVAAVNFAPRPVKLPLQDLPNHYELSKVQIIAVTSNVDQYHSREMTDFSDKTIVLKAEQGVVFRYQA